MDLEWEKNTINKCMTWKEANDYAYSLRYNWRLPTREELILAYKNKIQGFQLGYYWSSSLITEKYKYRFKDVYTVISFKNGFVNYKKDNNLYYVRCVREIWN